MFYSDQDVVTITYDEDILPLLNISFGPER
jgi:hypothetical protein